MTRPAKSRRNRWSSGINGHDYGFADYIRYFTSGFLMAEAVFIGKSLFEKQ